MFSESRNDRQPHGRRSSQGSHNATGIGDNSAEIGDNSAEIGDNSAEIGDSSAEIGDDAAVIVDNAANVIPIPKPNFILNWDWSNSVPGRQIPEGTTSGL